MFSKGPTSFGPVKNNFIILLLCNFKTALAQCLKGCKKSTFAKVRDSVKVCKHFSKIGIDCEMLKMKL